MDELIELYGDEFYDSPHLVSRKRIDNIADVPVLDDDGKEKLIEKYMDNASSVAVAESASVTMSA